MLLVPLSVHKNLESRNLRIKWKIVTLQKENSWGALRNRFHTFFPFNLEIQYDGFKLFRSNIQSFTRNRYNILHGSCDMCKIRLFPILFKLISCEINNTTATIQIQPLQPKCVAFIGHWWWTQWCPPSAGEWDILTKPAKKSNSLWLVVPGQRGRRQGSTQGIQNPTIRDRPPCMSGISFRFFFSPTISSIKYHLIKLKFFDRIFHNISYHALL